jgi:hypothetical protein
MRFTYCFCMVAIFLFSAELASADVIAGSVLRSPPQFQQSSFLVGLGGTWHEAYPFQVIPGDGWTIDRLLVPLYHYENMAGNKAKFSICSDVSGHPGAEIAAFSISNITIEQRVYSLAPTYSTGLLEGDATYWIVGWNAGGGQVNWNMDAQCGSYTRAYCTGGGDWVRQSGLCNMSSFAIEGTAVPEPSGMILAGAGVAGLLAYGWKKRKP